MMWLKQRLGRLCKWAKAEPTGKPGADILLAVWAFALAMGGGAAFRSGITLGAVKTFALHLLAGCFVWAIWAAAHTLIEREKTNLRRWCVLVAVLFVFTAFASQINMF